MTDRFTEATRELTENNPYLYQRNLETYGHPTITNAGDRRAMHPAELTGIDCLLNCDPIPFGD